MPHTISDDELIAYIIKEVFNAGIRRGEAPASAYEWGISAGGKNDDILFCDLCDILNETKEWEDPTRFTEETIKEFLKI